MARTSAASNGASKRPAASKAARSPSPEPSQDPLEWSQRHWEAMSFPDPDRFIAAMSVFRLREAVVAEFDRQLRVFGINRYMYLVLATLSLSPKGARRLGYLSRYLIVHPTTATLLVEQLEKQGLARRVPDPTDGRASLATLTPAGRAVMEETTRALAEAGFGFGGMDRQDVRQLTGSIRTARTAIGDIET
jgi:DNA-binding MarR family transcriptional regulator